MKLNFYEGILNVWVWYLFFFYDVVVDISMWLIIFEILNKFLFEN